MNKKEEEIQRKLLELESSVLKDQIELVNTGSGRTDLTTTGKNAKGGALNNSSGGKMTSGANSGSAALNKSDGYYFGGFALLILGMVMVAMHVKVGSGFLAMLMGGGGGLALFLLPLLAGIGMMIYNYKNKWGSIITGGSCALMLLAILFTLNFNFPTLTLMQTVMMFLPFAIGSAFVVKGMGGPDGIKDAIRSSLPKKEDA
ncbi:MAG: hypothetical protein QG574_3890 [Cyanobacteriota bacterium erpe_2018_sw_21hr_WHONDRS-SW48-000092_B_bin.40]|nr:hypothetical protein [Cyanobacteriota bacterium erpe_2018_sw_21hr_WHONDRS-SW48-000092_B_bin.40]